MTTMPPINLNDTAPRVLLEDHIAALEAVRFAISTLIAAAPNARDYQTAPEGTFLAAMSEHRNRLARLETVMNELDQIAQHIANHIK